MLLVHQEGGDGRGSVGAKGAVEGRTIVEAAGVPHPVVASGASMEVHAVSAIKHVDAIVGVLAGMAVHNVYEHNQAKPVSLIHQRLQFVGRSKPATSLHDHDFASRLMQQMEDCQANNKSRGVCQEDKALH